MATAQNDWHSNFRNCWVYSVIDGFYFTTSKHSEVPAHGSHGSHGSHGPGSPRRHPAQEIALPDLIGIKQRPRGILPGYRCLIRGYRWLTIGIPRGILMANKGNPRAIHLLFYFLFIEYLEKIKGKGNSIAHQPNVISGVSQKWGTHGHPEFQPKSRSFRCVNRVP